MFTSAHTITDKSITLTHIISFFSSLNKKKKKTQRGKSINQCFSYTDFLHKKHQKAPESTKRFLA